MKDLGSQVKNEKAPSSMAQSVRGVRIRLDSSDPSQCPPKGGPAFAVQMISTWREYTNTGTGMAIGLWCKDGPTSELCGERQWCSVYFDTIGRSVGDCRSQTTRTMRSSMNEQEMWNGTTIRAKQSGEKAVAADEGGFEIGDRAKGRDHGCCSS